MAQAWWLCVDRWWEWWLALQKKMAMDRIHENRCLRFKLMGVEWGWRACCLCGGGGGGLEFDVYVLVCTFQSISVLASSVFFPRLFVFAIFRGKRKQELLTILPRQQAKVADMSDADESSQGSAGSTGDDISNDNGNDNFRAWFDSYLGIDNNTSSSDDDSQGMPEQFLQELRQYADVSYLCRPTEYYEVYNWIDEIAETYTGEDATAVELYRKLNHSYSQLISVSISFENGIADNWLALVDNSDIEEVYPRGAPRNAWGGTALPNMNTATYFYTLLTRTEGLITICQRPEPVLDVQVDAPILDAP